jgi:hypothetical protein
LEPVAIPVVVKDRVPTRLFETALVDGADVLKAVDAQFIWADANDGTKPTMGIVEGPVLSLHEPDPENPGS